MTNDDGLKPEGTPKHSPKAGVGAPSGVDGNGPKRFSVQRKMAIVARLFARRRTETKVHDGTIITDKVNGMWGTDITQTITVGEGRAYAHPGRHSRFPAFSDSFGEASGRSCCAAVMRSPDEIQRPSHILMIIPESMMLYRNSVRHPRNAVDIFQSAGMNR